MKKIAILDPYLDILGGGERHILSIARLFAERGFGVDILWNNPDIFPAIKERLNLSFLQAQVIPWFQFSPWQRLIKTHDYEYFFYVTDGSYFFSLARHNYIFSLYPQASLYQVNWFNRLKWSRFEFLANSHFTQSWIDRWTGKKSTVIYPYVDSVTNLYKKDKIILTVGRFFKHLHRKRHDIIIQALKQLQQKDRLFKDFRLFLIGGLKAEDKDYFNELISLAKDNQNVVFLTNVKHDVVMEYYQKALFYWHAAGYDVDESRHPEQVEHLGMAPLEAMAAGCITFCHNAGGGKEIIKDGMNGFLYDNIEVLIKKTINLYQEKEKMEKISRAAQEYVIKHFSYDVFRKRVRACFNL